MSSWKTIFQTTVGQMFRFTRFLKMMLYFESGAQLKVQIKRWISGSKKELRGLLRDRGFLRDGYAF